ncbi:MAG: hypothetical protein IIB95_04825 [Candidatus Marinimicrobia bacterium]|nr:hypothetical protein [Candidatus Neomarinimicrobiota bacterium]MCH7763049.1 hypothetical protein [Candidatus Neomarinimicrobiota bacterium]
MKEKLKSGKYEKDTYRHLRTIGEEENLMNELKKKRKKKYLVRNYLYRLFQ